MKTMILAALAVVTLGVGAAFAQSGANFHQPAYGSAWAKQHQDAPTFQLYR